METGTSSINWAQQSGFCLMRETDSSLRMVMFLIKLGQWRMSRKFVILTIHHCHKPSDFIHCPYVASCHPILNVISAAIQLTSWYRGFVEKLIGIQLVKKFPDIMELRGSSINSQFRPYRKPFQHSLHLCSLCEVYFNIITLSYL
jgi:hypothetical protein